MPHEPGATLKQLVRLPSNPSGCWTWLGRCDDKGIPRKQHNGRPIAARRWLWNMLFGDIPPGLEVFGSCGTHNCVSPHHMRCGTPAHRVQQGVLSNLTPADVQQIKQAKRLGTYAKTALAMTLDVDLKILQAIWRGDSWVEISKPLHPSRVQEANHVP